MKGVAATLLFLLVAVQVVDWGIPHDVENQGLRVTSWAGDPTYPPIPPPPPPPPPSLT